MFAFKMHGTHFDSKSEHSYLILKCGLLLLSKARILIKLDDRKSIYPSIIAQNNKCPALVWDTVGEAP
jgi:hypothetical protein